MSSPRPHARSWHVGTVGVAVLAGLVLGGTARASEAADLRPASSDLPALIRTRDREVAAKAEKVTELEQEVNALTDARRPRDARVKTLSREGDRLAPAAGLAAVHGPGVSVQLDDSKGDATHPPAGFTAADMVVHQQDVESVINAFWRGGAEAMMVQDQRIVATSAVRCVGNTLLLQGRVYAPPYTVTAIGDPTALQAALEADPTVSVYRQYVAAVGLGYIVTPTNDVTVPEFAGTVSPRRADVVS